MKIVDAIAEILSARRPLRHESPDVVAIDRLRHRHPRLAQSNQPTFDGASCVRRDGGSPYQL